MYARLTRRQIANLLNAIGVTNYDRLICHIRDVLRRDRESMDVDGADLEQRIRVLALEQCPSIVKRLRYALACTMSILGVLTNKPLKTESG